MRSRTRLLTCLAVAAGTLMAPVVPGGTAGAAPSPEVAGAIDDAVAWLETQQQADGGFEVSGFPGFETPDAIAAIAAAAQTSATWSTTEALAAVEAVTTEGGLDALDAVDDWVDAVQGAEPGDGEEGALAAAQAQQAAKVIVLVTDPLGLDPTDFDPSDDSAEPVDLIAALEGGAGTGDFGGLPIGGRAFALWAFASLGETPPAGLVASIAAAQQANGGFSFTGDPSGTGFDPDITASVVIGLAVADGSTGATGAEVLRRAVTGLALQQRWTGEWAGDFDDGNPNSTAMVTLAAAFLGGDPDATCWRDSVVPGLTGLRHMAPSRPLLAAQQPDGRIASPADMWGVNTSATTQTVQALFAVQNGGGECVQPSVGNARRNVNALYADLLLRVGEEAGAAFWAGEIAGGMPPGLLAKRFVGTPEYGRVVAQRTVLALLGRPATGAEQATLGDAIRRGQRFAVIAGIMGSEEYVEATADDEEWVDVVYLDALGRPASPADIDFVLDQLDAGRSYESVALGVVRSAEGRARTVTETYRQLLRRNASAADRAWWGNELGRGVSPERVVTLIIGSDEYRNRTQA